MRVLPQSGTKRMHAELLPSGPWRWSAAQPLMQKPLTCCYMSLASSIITADDRQLQRFMTPSPACVRGSAA